MTPGDEGRESAISSASGRHRTVRQRQCRNTT